MKLKRWIVLPAAGLAAVIIGVAAVEAAPSPSASPTGSKNYAQVFVDKLAGRLHLTPTQTQDSLTQAQADSVLSRVGSGLDRLGHKPARPKTPGESESPAPSTAPTPGTSPAAYYSSI